MKKKQNTPVRVRATDLFTSARKPQWAPPPELLLELDELLMLNATEPANQRRIGAKRLAAWFRNEHQIVIGPDVLRAWMQNRSAELGLK